MTYSRPWRTYVSPNLAGSTFDDEQRNIRDDIEDRMQTLLASVGDWTTDPVAATATRHMYIHWSAFTLPILNLTKGALLGNSIYTGASREFDSTLYGYGIRAISVAGSVDTGFYTSVPLLPGSTLVDIDISCVVAQASSSIAATVYLVDATTSTVTETSLATRTLSNPTTQGNYSISSGSNINQAISTSDKEFVYVKIVMNTSTATGVAYGFQGIRVKYTLPPLLYV